MSQPTFQIVAYQADFAPDFARLNRAWVEQYLTVEPLDEEYLGDPEGHTLRPGGEIYFAVESGRVNGASSNRHRLNEENPCFA